MAQFVDRLCRFLCYLGTTTYTTTLADRCCVTIVDYNCSIWKGTQTTLGHNGGKLNLGFQLIGRKTYPGELHLISANLVACTVYFCVLLRAFSCVASRRYNYHTVHHISYNYCFGQLVFQGNNVRHVLVGISHSFLANTLRIALFLFLWLSKLKGKATSGKLCGIKFYLEGKLTRTTVIFWWHLHRSAKHRHHFLQHQIHSKKPESTVRHMCNLLCHAKWNAGWVSVRTSYSGSHLWLQI